MLSREACIAIGVIAGVVALGYLATRREIHATIEAGIATVTYNAAGDGDAAAPHATEDSHARMMRLIEESNRKIREYDADMIPNGAE